MSYADKVYTNIGNNIRKYRQLKGYSQEQLSELMDVNPKYIGHVERVERYISLKRLIQVSELLDVNLSTLVDFLR